MFYKSTVKKIIFEKWDDKHNTLLYRCRQEVFPQQSKFLVQRSRRKSLTDRGSYFRIYNISTKIKYIVLWNREAAVSPKKERKVPRAPAETGVRAFSKGWNVVSVPAMLQITIWNNDETNDKWKNKFESLNYLWEYYNKYFNISIVVEQ